MVHNRTKSRLRSDLLMSEVDKQYLTADQVLEIVPVARGTLYQYTSKGKIPHYKLGNRLVFERSEILAWLKSKRRSYGDG